MTTISAQEAHKIFTRNTEVAVTILDQLGGNRFKVMTGAKHLMAIESGLSFRFPAHFAKNGINHIEIRLNSSDTYDIRFVKVGRAPNYKVTIIAEISGVYVDMLRKTIEVNTGLYLSL